MTGGWLADIHGLKRPFFGLASGVRTRIMMVWPCSVGVGTHVAGLLEAQH